VGKLSKTSVSPTALLPALKKNFAEVENGVRLYNPRFGIHTLLKPRTNFFKRKNSIMPIALFSRLLF